MPGDELIKPQPDLRSVAQNKFEEAVRAAGLDPEDKWIGGYFDYEWTHLRPLLYAYDLAPYSGRDIGAWLQYRCVSPCYGGPG